MIAVAINREIGWVAWGIGMAAGGGMAAGYHDKSDGTVPGILAAFIALGGIVMGKVFILVWVLYPLLTGDMEDFAFKREAVAGRMAATALEQRGIDLETNDAEYEKEYRQAMQTLADESDEEIDRRFAAMMEEASGTAVVAAEVEAEAGAGALPAAGGMVVAADQADIEMPDDVEDPPSLLGAFFSTMFGPMDAVFILLAFFTAYKVGSGSVTGD